MKTRSVTYLAILLSSMLVSYLIPYGSLVWLLTCALFMQFLGHWKTITVYLAYQTVLLVPVLPVLWELAASIGMAGDMIVALYICSAGFAYLFLLALLFFLHKFFHTVGIFKRLQDWRGFTA